MKKKYVYAFFIILSVVALLLGVLYLLNIDIAVLSPKGLIAIKERNLFVISTLLMLIVVIPVFIMTIYISWKYRASNTKAKYTPDWDQNLLIETIWWGVPCAIILVLSILTWKGSYDLDPFKPIDSSEKPIKIQVVALQWKWLFIYPEEKIATVNFFQIPEKTPIYFEITADAPMNSFWVPHLSGQVFAMPAMKTKLHFIADEIGSYRGSSANISGKGFADMFFTVKSSSKADYEHWVQTLKGSASQLNLNEYKKLALPSENNPVGSYLLTDEGIFDWIIMKYMMPMPKEGQ